MLDIEIKINNPFHEGVTKIDSFNVEIPIYAVKCLLDQISWTDSNSPSQSLLCVQYHL